MLGEGDNNAKAFGGRIWWSHSPTETPDQI